MLDGERYIFARFHSFEYMQTLLCIYIPIATRPFVLLAMKASMVVENSACLVKKSQIKSCYLHVCIFLKEETYRYSPSFHPFLSKLQKIICSFYTSLTCYITKLFMRNFIIWLHYIHITYFNEYTIIT